MRESLKRLGAAVGLALTTSVVAAVAAATYSSRRAERLDYETVLTFDGVELRRYPQAVLVETTAGTPRKAFPRLFGYITGENDGERAIEMTAPVRVDSARIPMTAPVRIRDSAPLPGVEETAADSDVTMAFYLPSEYTTDTAPEPTNPDVSLVTEPARTLAVVGFSWWPTPGRVRDHEQQLLDALDERGIEPTGDPFFLGYDAPGTLPFLRTNEVAVPVREE